MLILIEVQKLMLAWLKEQGIEKAKKDQVPADVIKRALDKVSSGTGEDYKANRYEGFGPSGATIIVDCLTDNVNRTISEVKNCFTKTIKFVKYSLHYLVC